MSVLQEQGLAAGVSLDALMKTLSEAPTLVGDPRLPEHLAKSTFSQSGSATTGLTFYDLEAGAKFLYPILTPLRNEIPRVSGKGGIQANWKAVTGINTSGIRIGVSGGNRGAVIAVTTADYAAAYKGIGLESNVDFEADYAARGFADVRAIAAKSGLEALMLGEEQLLLGGNGTVALGTTPTSSVTVNASGGALAATQYVNVVALTLEGYANSSVAAGIPTQITRTNADGSVDTFGGGSARVSAQTTATISSGTANSILATVPAVKGAVAYAWFWGSTTTNGVLGAITTVNRVTITGAAAGTQLMTSLPAADNSTNNLVFDGLITQIAKTGSNSYYRSLDGSEFTADNAGGIVEIDTALKHFWDNYKLTPDTIWLSSQEALSISRKILAGGSNGAYRIVVNMEQGMLAGGVMVATYLNRFSMAGANVLKVRLHPNMPAGTVLFTTKTLPYPLNNVNNVMQVRTRQEYYQIEWPLRTRKYEYGVYADEVFQHYFPPSMGMIVNVGSS